MGESDTSSLTVAKLKALCIIHDLPTSGKKAELIERLLEAGVERRTLGLEDDSISNLDESEKSRPVENGNQRDSHPSPAKKKTLNESPMLLSLEDDETLTPPASKPSSPQNSKTEKAHTDEIFEAEILDATLIDIDDESIIEVEEGNFDNNESQNHHKNTVQPMTLVEMLQQPKAMAVLLSVIILGAGGWYYLSHQLEPFTADSLRYGDSMRYIISDGEFMATEEFVTIITDQLETDDDICKIQMLFDGVGDVAITDGDSAQLNTQASLDRLGAVSTKGGQGMDWLTVESTNTMDFTGAGELKIQRHLRSLIPGSNACREDSLGGSGSGTLSMTRWTELREQVSLASQTDFTLSLGGEFQGTATTYGIGGLLGKLGQYSPGLSLILQPVELKDFFGSTLITEDAIGVSSGWEWRVIGSERIGATDMWKVTASHQAVRDLCLGYASMTLWLDETSPGAVRQLVDVSISSSTSIQESCSGLQEIAGDLLLPEGELELHHMFERSQLKRGVKPLELGKSHDNRPQANDLNPRESDLSDWGNADTHLPDNSSIRAHALELAIQCIEEPGWNASGAKEALRNDGYIWRASTSSDASLTEWNISWVDTGDNAGWVLFSVRGQSGSLDCEVLEKGPHDSVSHSRDSIPSVLSLDQIEARLMDASRFPMLTGTDAFFTSGLYHPETHIGYLVVVPGVGLGYDLSSVFNTVEGATTIDVQRQWNDGDWDHQTSLLVDGTDGRLIGWTHVQYIPEQ